MKNIQSTSDSKLLLLPRLIAGGVLTFFGMMHFSNLQHFREILTAAQFPMVDVNAIAASGTELFAGLLLISGFFTRVGGAMGIATMLPAIYATLRISGLTSETLPSGLEVVPMIPPLPLPIVVTVTSVAVLILGGGSFSVDHCMTRPDPQSDEAAC